MDFVARQASSGSISPPPASTDCSISHLPNLRYLCGFTGSAGTLLVEDPAASSLLMSVMTRRRTKRSSGESRHSSQVDTRSPCRSSPTRRKRRPGMDVGIEAEHFTIAEKKRLASCCPRAYLEGRSADRRARAHDEGRGRTRADPRGSGFGREAVRPRGRRCSVQE